jgi:hypothetical protein
VGLVFWNYILSVAGGGHEEQGDIFFKEWRNLESNDVACNLISLRISP